jgi:hypothetical protein
MHPSTTEELRMKYKVAFPLVLLSLLVMIYFVAGVPPMWEIAAWIAWIVLSIWLVARAAKEDD